MRSRWPALLVSLSLFACGGRSAIESDATGGASASSSVIASSSSTGVGGGTPPSFAHIQASCAPADGPAILLTIEAEPGCPSAAPVGIQFLIWGAELATLGPDTTLMVGGTSDSDVEGSRTFSTNGASTMTVPMSGGSITFTTYTPKGDASGTFMVNFADGANAAGSFGATFCPGNVACGG